MDNRKCIRCNKEFKIFKSRTKKYCSYKCFYLNGGRWKNKTIIKDKFCLTCGKKLGWSARYQPQRNIKYCRKCFTKSVNFNQKASKGWFKKGQLVWNKGLKGFMAGEKNSNWKGGISKINRSERKNAMQTIEYKLWRKSVFERDHYTCIKCLSKGKIQADHIKPWAIYPELRYAIDNGQTLCENCHKLKNVVEMRIYWKNQFSSGIYKLFQQLNTIRQA